MTRCAVVLVFSGLLPAQESRFNARSRLVIVPVNIEDARGRRVAGLEPLDFLLFDNGVAQKPTVDTIDTGVAPIALIIAVQSSGISTAVLEKVHKIGSMIVPLVAGARGCAGLVSFDEGVHWLQDCTKDENALSRAFSALRPGEDKQAHMLDAVVSAVDRLRTHPGTRPVLLLISESRDRGSETALEKATTAAQSAGVAVYAATYSAIKTAFTSKAPVSDPKRPLKPKTPNDAMQTVDGAPPSKYNRRQLPPEQQVDAIGAIGEVARLGQKNAAETLADATGGAVFAFTKQKALEKAIQNLGSELHSQYVLSFVPQQSTAGYHALQVRLARPGEFHIHARPGYWTGEDPR